MTDVHQDRRQSDANIAALTLRITDVEAELHALTLSHEKVCGNLADLVKAMDSLIWLWAFLRKWGRRSRTLAKHVTIYAVAITATWAAVKTVFGVDIFEWLRAWWHR